MGKIESQHGEIQYGTSTVKETLLKEVGVHHSTHVTYDFIGDADVPHFTSSLKKADFKLHD
jgi:hypothetical protein